MKNVVTDSEMFLIDPEVALYVQRERADCIKEQMMLFPVPSLMVPLILLTHISYIAS